MSLSYVPPWEGKEIQLSVNSTAPTECEFKAISEPGTNNPKRERYWMGCVVISTNILALFIETLWLYFCRHVQSCNEGYIYTGECGNWEQNPVCCREIMGSCSCADTHPVIYSTCSYEDNIIQVIIWTSVTIGIQLLCAVCAILINLHNNI